MNTTRSRCLMLFSGGPDSTSATYLLKYEKDLVLFTVSEPKKIKNNSEVTSAVTIAEMLGMEHKVFDTSFGNQLFSDLSEVVIGLGGGNAPGKDIKVRGFTKYECATLGNTEMQLSIPLVHISAAIYASMHGIAEIIWGVHKDDDIPHGWIESYVSHFNTLMRVMGVSISLNVPFLGYTKAELIKKGYAAGAPLSITFSCLAKQDGIHRGICAGCREREVAFRMAGIDELIKHNSIPAKNTVAAT
jgi:7-cyano-7-deazaguanine synthase